MNSNRSEEAPMKTIKDSIHDHVEVGGVGLDLLDSPPVQRLRHVKQLGTVHLVYPSANHTRFEHSLGVYHLACEALDHLGIESPTADCIRAAALLHDIGHPPYSHNIETLFERRHRRGRNDLRERNHHERIAQELITDGEVAAILESYDLDPGRVADLVAGDGRYAPLVSGEFDVDRMDYLVRDAHHTGVPYGTIDHGRLIHELAFVDDDLVLGEGNVQTAENLLIARALMNQTVYNHHVARISKAMLWRATERLLDEGISESRLWRMDDHELSVALRNHDATNELARRILRRDLYKRAVWTGFEDLPREVENASHDDVREFEAEIAADVGIDPTEVIVDIPPEEPMPELSTRVTVDREIKRLKDASMLVGTLQEDQRKKRRFGVYTPEGYRDVVGDAAERTLGL